MPLQSPPAFLNQGEMSCRSGRLGAFRCVRVPTAHTYGNGFKMRINVVAWLILLFLSFVASVALYGIAVAPYRPPWNNPIAAAPIRVNDENGQDVGTQRDALRILVNDPRVEVRSKYHFNLFREGGELTLWADITFFNVQDPATFRWALVGTGSMRFEANVIPLPGVDLEEEYDHLPEFVDAYQYASPESWLPANIQSCDSRFESTGPVSAIFGGNRWSQYVTTNGYIPLAMNNATFNVKFPEIVADTSLIGETWEFGLIGDTSASVDFGTLHVEVDDCVSIGETDLTSPERMPQMEISLRPSAGAPEGAKLVSATPPGPLSSESGVWQPEGAVQIKAEYESDKMVKVRDALIFAAGIMGGIFASLLTVGLSVQGGVGRGR